MPDFHRVNPLDDASFIRGPARILWCGITISMPANIGAVINMSTYDPMTNWNDLGATKNGIQITYNNTEDNFDVDQIISDLKTIPSGWEMSVRTEFAEANLDRLQFSWEGYPITTDALDGGTTKVAYFGAPLNYTQRRLAVLFQRPSGKVRAFIFRIVQKSPTESSLTYAKTGEQQTIPMSFKCFPDLSVSDPLQRFVVVRDQQ